ncbi:MAG: metal ABC transporter permease [Solirubrobacterales bacterium]
MGWLIDPFQAEFVRTGALAAAAVGVICGVVGCYVILRGMALMSDSLAHGVLPGVAIAFALSAGAAGSSPDQTAIWLGALAAGLFTAGATNFVLRRTRVREETAAAVVFVFMLALGVAIVSRVQGYSVDLTSFLFGDVLGVSNGEATLSAVFAVAIVALVLLLYRPFLMLSFDPQRAAALGLPVERLHLAMLVLVTLAVVIGFRVVGALLVLGLLIAPPATAALLTKRLPVMMVLSAAIAAASAPLGLILSWNFDLAAGASIVLVAVSGFVVALALPVARR